MSTETRHTQTTLHLPQPWMIAIRGLWLVLVVMVLGLLVLAVGPRYQQLLLVSPDALPGSGALLPEDAQVLAQRGISVEWYAAAFVTLEVIIALSFAWIGIAVFLRKPNDWMALFTSLVLMPLGASASVLLNPLYDAQPALRLPVVLMRGIGFGFVIFFYLFPDGRFVPRWTRWTALVWVVFVVIGGFLFPRESILSFILGQAANQIGVVVFVIAITGSAMFAQIYRYRHVSTAIQRQQTKWVIYGMAVVFFSTVLVTIPSRILPVLREPGEIRTLYRLFMLLVLLPTRPLIPLTIAISIFRYRLYDIDIIVNRSVTYVALTVALGVVFLGMFAALRAVLETLLGEGQVVIAVGVSAALVAGMFNPARQRLRRFVDRRFYGIQIDYQPQPARQQTVISATAGQTGKTLGEYHHLEPLGKGGMAVVYQARHSTHSDSVAVKVLSPEMAQTNPQMVRRFRREAQMIAALQHTNIIQIYDYGEADGCLYIAMEHIHGPSLDQLLKQNQRLPLERTRAILADVAAALDYAHTQGFVHRDIKPSNVMVEAERAVLMDFGIARVMAGGETRLTSTGALIGTLDYIAPEQIQAVEIIDGRADIYALGVMTYQMLTGELPFKQQNTGALVMAHLMQPPPNPGDLVPGLPPQVVAAVRRAMSKRPDSRFETAGEFVASLA